MTPERYHQIDALTEAALNINPAEREAFLQRACGSDHDLLMRVTQLVNSHMASSGFLEVTALEAWARDVASSAGDAGLEQRRIGRYLIVSSLGSGGAGEVWLAKDLELKRDVALKVLSPGLAGADDVSRFRQEAYAASSLNHPNLVTVFDIGDFEGGKFIAQEYVPGKTLRQILREGLPSMAETLRIAAQVTQGLKAAHAAGIVHRDIKPENIMVRPDGLVKVLDFGLARVISQPSQAADDAAMEGLTRPGMIVGTVRYMSPEQARGLSVDARTDIFSLGVVIYELLAGTAPFNGNTPSDILAAILTADPAPLSGFGGALPDSFERVVRRCLEKDPSARYPSAAALAIDLERLSSLVSDASARPSPASPPAPPRRVGRRLPGSRKAWLALATVTVAAAAAAILLVPRFRTGPAGTPPAVVRSSLALPPGHVPEAVTISPAGDEIVYQISQDGVRRLYRRYLEEEESRLVPGSEGGTQPFFSPDGRELAYYSQASIRVVGSAGVRDLVPVPIDFRLRKAIWADDGFVYYTTANQGILRVSARGGKPEPAVSALGIPGQPDPFLFPQQKLVGNPPALLLSTNSGPRLRSVIWAPLSGTSPARVVVERGMGGQVLSSGHLLYMNQRKLFAAPFNARTRTLSGSAVEVIERVSANGFVGPNASVSNNGTLVYIEKRDPRSSLVLVDRSGRETPVSAPIDYYEQAELSPDGGRIAISRHDGPELWTLWIYNLRSGAWSRVLDMDVPTVRSVWAPDGKSLVVSAVQGDAQFVNLYRLPLDKPEALQRLTEDPRYGQFPGAWSGPAGLILFTQGVNQTTATDIFAITPGAPGPPRAMVATKGVDRTPAISPDGRWFAYSSAGSNTPAVFLQRLDQSSPPRQVSSGGGTSPAWSPDGKHLYYLDPARALMELPFHANGETGAARRLLPPGFTADTDWWTRGYSIGPGGRFLVLRHVAEEAANPRIRVIVNWTSQLDRLAPVMPR